MNTSIYLKKLLDILNIVQTTFLKGSHSSFLHLPILFPFSGWKKSLPKKEMCINRLGNTACCFTKTTWNLYVIHGKGPDTAGNTSTLHKAPKILSTSLTAKEQRASWHQTSTGYFWGDAQPGLTPGGHWNQQEGSRNNKRYLNSLSPIFLNRVVLNNPKHFPSAHKVLSRLWFLTTSPWPLEMQRLATELSLCSSQRLTG